MVIVHVRLIHGDRGNARVEGRGEKVTQKGESEDQPWSRKKTSLQANGRESKVPWTYTEITLEQKDT